MTLYFNVARFWGDVGYVMDLTIEDLLLHAQHGTRIQREERGR